MTPKLYLICFLISMLGMVFSIVMKAVALQKKARISNASFNGWKFLKDDWLSGLSSLLFIGIVLVIISEVLHWKPVVIDYIKIIFVFVGYFGSELGSRLFSATNKRLNAIIDEKTDKADGMPDSQ